ncbi:MAG TPA: hypothetical protein VGQ44_20890 [Gemmatimonadaceae bacterium]|nr:hypothetical protein [Gemmatimonadaceae bacterium]
MFHRWPALVLVLAVSAMMPKQAAGQQTQSPQKPSAGKFGRSWPNPFNPIVRTNFSIGSGSCVSGETHAVTVRILNILAQPVVIPVLFGPAANSTSGASSSMNGSPISNLRLECGDYVSFWDGYVQDHSRQAASGTYVVQLIVDGKLANTTRIYFRK